MDFDRSPLVRWRLRQTQGYGLVEAWPPRSAPGVCYSCRARSRPPRQALAELSKIHGRRDPRDHRGPGLSVNTSRRSSPTYRQSDGDLCFQPPHIRMAASDQTSNGFFPAWRCGRKKKVSRFAGNAMLFRHGRHITIREQKLGCAPRSTIRLRYSIRSA